jgi:hypothetical protein
VLLVDSAWQKQKRKAGMTQTGQTPAQQRKFLFSSFPSLFVRINGDRPFPIQQAPDKASQALCRERGKTNLSGFSITNLCAGGKQVNLTRKELFVGIRC